MDSLNASLFFLKGGQHSKSSKLRTAISSKTRLVTLNHWFPPENSILDSGKRLGTLKLNQVQRRPVEETDRNKHRQTRRDARQHNPPGNSGHGYPDFCNVHLYISISMKVHQLSLHKWWDFPLPGCICISRGYPVVCAPQVWSMTMNS